MVNQFVCSNCFGNTDLKRFLKETSVSLTGNCDFCKSHNVPIYPLTTISQKIKDCLFNKYCEDSSATQDVITIIASEAQCNNLLAAQIKNILNLPDNLMNKKDAYWLLNSYNPLDLKQSFESFVFYIKHTRRFILTDEDFSFLKQLSSFLTQKSFISTLTEGTILYRARQGKHTNKRDLWAPPYPYSPSNNRMTPAGVEGSLYVADSPNTAIKEVRGEAPVTVAKIKILEDLLVLDLSNKPNSVSCFHKDYLMYSFLNAFIEEISKSIKSNEKDYEYVPTQIIAEFLRIKLCLDGIVYRSSIYPDGRNYVLFGQYNLPCNRTELPLGNKRLTIEELNYF